ncbi:AMP-binding-domain-containing protein [Tilletiaria anomala UBC 951]|uniref:AMP-binding-domain-containing protein n=1 Tax=Tilletiaria anomala (strain ATCC 24038 / CBS 436.72 / UBC 951) TaxID=1037660 RepID=A0A066V9J2_TILAU|nr:AMP-binding-domain-containing protein [Tilletiaria anomala UBC 951]KDN38156.1 AMP-binding-domain-containing protein [Tilletiaria anomala UBC 951]
MSTHTEKDFEADLPDKDYLAHANAADSTCPSPSASSSLPSAPTLVPGRLFIGGQGVADGYTDADRTRAAFQFDDTLGTRLYDTGDVARHLPSGELEFLGRKDHQVKIRGHRIELEEITHQLHRIHGVRECAVDVVSGNLVGFVAPVHTMPPVTPYGSFDLISDDFDRLGHKATFATRSSIEHLSRVDGGQALPIPVSDRLVAMRETRASHYLFETDSPSLDALSSIFNEALAEFRSGVPSGGYKHHHPSPGAPYSIGILLHCNGIDGLANGFWAADDKAGELQLLVADDTDGEARQEAGTRQLFFFSHLPAVALLYGSATTDLVACEYGYLLGAMGQEARRNGLSLHFERASEERGLHFRPLGLSPTDDVVLGKVTLVAGHTSATASDPAVSVQAGRVGSHDYGGELQKLVPKHGVAWSAADQPVAFHHNAELLQSATVIVTMAVSGDAVAAGALAQTLMDKSAPHLVGWTQVPWMDPTWDASFAASYQRKPKIILVGGTIARSTPSDPSAQTSLAIVNRRLSL